MGGVSATAALDASTPLRKEENKAAFEDSVGCVTLLSGHLLAPSLSGIGPPPVRCEAQALTIHFVPFPCSVQPVNAPGGPESHNTSMGDAVGAPGVPMLVSQPISAGGADPDDGTAAVNGAAIDANASAGRRPSAMRIGGGIAALLEAGEQEDGSDGRYARGFSCAAYQGARPASTLPCLGFAWTMFLSIRGTNPINCESGHLSTLFNALQPTRRR